jgi:zinc transporter
MAINDISYGSNADGLIWGYRFVPGQPAELISTDAVPAILSANDEAAKREFVWLHFSLSNQASQRYMHRQLALPEAFFESLHGEIGSTTLALDADMLLAVIHDVLFDSAFDALEVGTTSLSIGPRLLVSARLRPLRSVEQLRAAVRAGQDFRSTIELLAHLLQDQADVLGDILRKSTARIDRIEDQLLANRNTTERSELGSMRRRLVRLQRLMAPEPTALFRLLNRPPAWVSHDDLQDLRQAAEEFSTTIGDCVALVERIRLIQEELSALVNEQTGRTLFMLTVFTVLALPINLIAGLFGMNVGGIPLADDRHGFMLIIGALISLTAVLAYFAFGRKRS